MKIGDLFYQLLIEDGKLIAQAKASGVKAGTAAGDEAGRTMGARMSATLKTTLGVGAKVAATALAGGLAIAARGAAELENITADFQAATGASADEAVAAGKTINRVAGDERQSLQSVSAAAIKVRTDLGATGPEADKLTAAFVRFARVTKQDAAGSVADFDDILDAWGLTAADSVGIMDKLLVSQQRFGGSITESQKALAALAPSLKAANLNIDDGIGLLNLFQASGVDAAVAVTGMTKALTKVKSPAELKALIADIIATEDPFLRAQKASDLFGAKAGAKLANALKPGAKALGDYQISVEDAAGATDKAADIIDNTFTGRIQKAISQATAGLREFGAGFGPALTGLASLSTLAGAAGGGKLVKGILGPIGGLGKALAVKLAAAVGVSFASRAVSGAAEAGGEFVGDLTAKQIQRRLAGKVATDLLATGLSDGLIGVESSSKVSGATGRLGTLMGSKLGTAVKLGFLAALGTIVVDLLAQLADLEGRVGKQAEDIGTSIGHQIATGTLEELEASKAALEKGISDLDPFALLDFTGTSNRLQADLKRQLAEVNAAIEAGAGRVGRASHDLTEHVTNIPKDIAAAVGATTAASNQIVGAIERSFGLGAGPISQATKLMLAGVPIRVREASFAAALAAAKTPGEIADAIQSRRNLVDAAMDNLTSVIKNNKGSERAKVLGYLIGSELAKALKSKDPLIRTTAEETQKLLLSRLEEVIPANGQIGKAAMDQLNAGIKSKNPAVAEQARRIKDIIEAKIKANTKAVGEQMATDLGKGLMGESDEVAKKAHNLGARAARALKAGFGNPNLTANIVLGNSGFLGGARVEGGPVKKGVPYVVGEKRPEVFVPETDGTILPSVPTSRPGEPAPSPAAAGPAVAAKLVEVVTRSIANVAREVTSSVSDTTVVLRELVEKISARPPAPPAAAARAPQMAGVKWELRPQSFARGGVVQGPPGQPVGIIAHGGEEVVTAKDRREPETVSTAIVHAITRTLSDIAHRVSDTTIVMRRIVENVERAPVTPAAKAQGASSAPRVDAAPVSPAVVASVAAVLHKVEKVASPPTAEAREVSRSAHSPASSVSTTVVNVLTRSLTEVVRRVSDTSDVLRRITEKVERPERPIVPAAVRPAQAGPTITVRKPGPPVVAPLPGVAPTPPYVQPIAPRAVAQAVSTRVKQMREAMPGPWMPAATMADVGGSLRPPASHVPSFRAPSIAPARVPSGLAAVPAAGGGSVREGDIHVNLLDKLEVRSVRDIGGGLRMLGEQGYLGPKGPGRRKG